MSDEPATRQVIAICETADCANAEHTIALIVPDEPNPLVVCGVCGMAITNVTDIP